MLCNALVCSLLLSAQTGRDARHSGHVALRVVSVERLENSRLWQQYISRRHLVALEAESAAQNVNEPALRDIAQKAAAGSVAWMRRRSSGSSVMVCLRSVAAESV